MAGRDGGITKKCEKISIWAAGGWGPACQCFDSFSSGEVTSGRGGAGEILLQLHHVDWETGDWPSLCGKTAIIVSRQTLQAPPISVG